jgi:hypothetical protein
MKEKNFICKYICNCEKLTKYIKTQLENESEETWDKYNFRSIGKEKGAQKDTFCIPLYWIQCNWMDISTTIPVTIYRFIEFEKYFTFIEKIKDLLFQHYPNTILYQIAFTKLPSKKEITPHTDCHSKCSYPHRIHVVIKSNSNVTFFIKDVAHKFKEGEIVEINNMEKHSVTNDSDEDRIHLLIDLINLKHLPCGFQYEDITFEKIINDIQYYFGKNGKIRPVM